MATVRISSTTTRTTPHQQSSLRTQGGLVEVDEGLPVSETFVMNSLPANTGNTIVDTASRSLVIDSKALPLFNINIISNEVKKGHSKDKKHVYYCLQVSSSTHTGASWTVLRKYSDFEVFHALLTEKCVTKPPDLPGKKLVRSFKESYIAKKGSELEKYLQAVALMSEAYMFDDFTSFLVGAVGIQRLLEDMKSIETNAQAAIAEKLTELGEQSNEMAKRCRYVERKAERQLSEKQNLIERATVKATDAEATIAALQAQLQAANAKVKQAVADLTTEREQAKKSFEADIVRVKKQCNDLEQQRHTAQKELKVARMEKKVLIIEIKHNRHQIAELKQQQQQAAAATTTATTSPLQVSTTPAAHTEATAS